MLLPPTHCSNKSDEGKMTKIEAIVQPQRFEVVKDALLSLGVDGMTVSEVRGHDGEIHAWRSVRDSGVRNGQSRTRAGGRATGDAGNQIFNAIDLDDQWNRTGHATVFTFGV